MLHLQQLTTPAMWR